MKSRNYLLFLFSTIFLIASAVLVLAQDEPRKTDLPRSKDYPLVSRYKGAVIQSYSVDDYEKYVLGTGRIVEKNFRGQGKYFAKFIDLEGKITRIQYIIPKKEGMLKVYKNYEIALKNADFEILFTMKDDSWTFWNENYYGGDNPINGLDKKFYEPFGKYGYFYLAAKAVMNEKNVYISLFFSKDSYYGKDLIIVTQEVIETKPLLTGLVKAEKITNSIKTKGHIAIYGIYFDTGKYNIKTESESALREIASFLKKHRNKKYFIVGHTDNAGNFVANMTLSKNRAKAVMNYLVKKLGVKARQLKANGVASLSPVTSNSTEAGKARNRRVEIVEQ